MIKYSFIMPYYKRNDLFRNTLESYKKHYSNRNDYEIIIIEDYKNQIDKTEHDLFVRTLEEYSKLFKFAVVARPQEDIYNPAPYFNAGALYTNGEFLLLTNPECIHKQDILLEFDKIFQSNKNSYIVCACYDEVFGWKQHSIHENRLLHWCNGISKFNFFKMGGFDVNFARGMAYEDDDFAIRISKSQFLNIVIRDDLLIHHQTHECATNQILWDINYEYFITKWGNIKQRLIVKNLNIKYSIILIYTGNLEELKNTIDSLCNIYAKNKEYEIVVVESRNIKNSQEQEIKKLLYPYNKQINIIYLSNCGSNESDFNYGIGYSNGNHVIVNVGKIDCKSIGKKEYGEKIVCWGETPNEQAIIPRNVWQNAEGFTTDTKNNLRQELLEFINKAETSINKKMGGE